jgi:nucleoside-diphosphate-sugar epimerase
VLLTGATGFLGGHILAALRHEDEFEVVAACRTPARLPDWFEGEVRQGDLTDPAYRQSLFDDIDIVLHVGTWGAFWGHKQAEKTKFFDVARDMAELAIQAGIDRFAVASTVAVTGRTIGSETDDFAPSQVSGVWPHLDYLIALDAHMQQLATPDTNMTVMRLGHFMGPGNQLGLVPALVPRLKTHIVPWLAGGKNRLPLVSGQDMARAFVCFCKADNLAPYESFNICHAQTPSMKEVVRFISERAGVPKPIYSVPFWAAYLFGGLMELTHPILPGKAPFLTRSLVRVSEDRKPSIDYAQEKLGFVARDDWHDVVASSIKEVQAAGLPWPALAQS